MDIDQLAQRQRTERQSAAARRAQRIQSPTQYGTVTSLGDRVTVSIQGGAGVVATHLGGVLRLGDQVGLQSDGSRYWVRGSEAL
jgi:hypothetical protein